MINASDPLEYIPSGRVTVSKHPEFQTNEVHEDSNLYQSTISEKLNNVNAGSKPSKDFWILRDSKNDQEEELYCSGKLAVYSKGCQVEDSLQTSFCCETNIVHATWCKFYVEDKDQIMKCKIGNLQKFYKTAVDCVCLVDSYTLKVFTEFGENYSSSLQFKVSAVWSTKYGILLERSIQPAAPYSSFSKLTLDNTKNVSTTEEPHTPTVYSLTHPLDDICPVLIKYGNTSYTWDTSLRILFTSSEPSFAFVFDAKSGLHSIYKIRKASKEECQIINASSENTSLIYNSMFSSSLNHTSNTAIGLKNSTCRTHLSNLGTSSSPFRSRAASCTTTGSANISLSSQHLSRSHSPMATISRCQSPTNPIFSTMNNSSGGYFGHHSRSSHQTLLALSAGQSDRNAGHYNRPTNQYLNNSPMGATVPELCLEHIWTENPALIKDNNADHASRVFLTTDLIGQTYLCYLIQNQYRLYLVRLEKSNEPNQIIMGMVNTITAKDAISLPKLNMMAVMESNGNIIIYSGTSFIGKLHIPNVVPNIVGNNYVLSSVYGRDFLSPYPRRSSLISPNRQSTPDVKFDEGVHLLSPVGGGAYTQLDMIDNSLFDGGPVQLKSAVSNKLILEYGDSNYVKMTLPTLKGSPLVLMCLQTLKNILPRDLGMQLLVKWYVARNAPGPEDLSINQEWNLFLNIFFTLFGYDINKLHINMNNDLDPASEHYSPIILSKKQKTINNGSNDDWSYLVASEVTSHVQTFLYDAIGLHKWKHKENNDTVDVMESENIKLIKVNIQSQFAAHLPNILFSLHLLYEELKLSSIMSESLFLLSKLLYQLSMDLNLHVYRQHYFSDFPVLSKNQTEFLVNDADTNKIAIPSFISADTPSIFKNLYNLLTFSNVTSYPYLVQVNPTSRNLIQLFAMLKRQKDIKILELDHFFKTISSVTNEAEYVSEKSEKETMEEIIMHCHKTGINKQQLENMPLGLRFIFSNVIHQCRENPPTNWPASVYELIDRQDLAVLQKKIFDSYYLDSTQDKIVKNNSDDVEHNDGMEFDYTILRLRFNLDHRVREVRKLLDSSEPVRIAIIQRPDVSDHEFIVEQEKFLHALCTRTMALPIARGMFTLRTSMPMNTEQLPIPKLCLTGKAPPRGTTVELTHIDVPANMNLWPLFHNGVATGLCIHPSAQNVDSTWIVYNKQQQGEFGIEHSGFLMALGLNGHLKNLAPFSMYEYLVECHESTSVGLLLGLSATHRSSMDVAMTKLLSLHVETLLPPTSIELNVQQNVQVAALMGVGLVYQGTNHRHIAHALLSEIGRPPGPEMKNSVDRESYSLTAGLALGLVVLSSGGGSDLASIPDTLHYYMVGGNTRPFSGAQKDKYKSPSYQIREGDSINIDVTSPGATMALGLMYLKTNNHAVAEWMAAPNTQYLLDFVRPDFLLLRILAKSLILWDEIEPSKTWVSSHVPDIVAKYKLQKPTANISEPIDLETINQAYCNIIAGACMAVGLKYAGTENMIAFNTLYHFLKMFMTLSHKSVAELAGKATIETCLNVVLLAASIVMAGTGNLDILRVCRYMRTRVGPTNSVVTYGSHVATHMALGFLFLGGGSYTLSNDPSSVAALVISLFPKFPTHSNDNRYHLQALRHFYVLATEPRLLLPKDIDNKKYCYAKIRLTFQSDSQNEGQKIVLKAPCLVPQLDRLDKIELDDDRYWKITFDKDRNFDLLKEILNANCVLHVKQRAGCLSHTEDPQGFRTLLAQTLTTEDIIVWTASLKQITSFTTDTTVLNFVNGFLKKGDLNHHTICDSFCMNKMHDKLSSLCCSGIQDSSHETSINFNNVNEIPQEISVTENHYLQILISMTYECVIKDKINFLPLWISIYKTLVTIEKEPTTNLIWQIKFLHSFKFCNNFFQGVDKLLNVENILANKQHLYLITDSWESDISIILKNLLNIGCARTRIKAFEKLSSYILNYNVPCQIDQHVVNPPENPIQDKNTTCLTAYGAFRFNSLFGNR
ncbi:anaphase-promoting complex subunit 1 [Nasonia vitripennis]|uniref:Anaphase-promoting complex subunit 1 n=1 Tax=Nasonia vitripennis TaxID=7425 RepID=A0A7M7LTT9_NASVI|nr:anaphase-promoting complex subunit 1 [Nasonia vitripennis]XP_008202866.1 anaphase-promoting complex subunit 1 [Nasonia vitripennis]